MKIIFNVHFDINKGWIKLEFFDERLEIDYQNFIKSTKTKYFVIGTIIMIFIYLMQITLITIRTKIISHYTLIPMICMIIDILLSIIYYFLFLNNLKIKKFIEYLKFSIFFTCFIFTLISSVDSEINLIIIMRAIYIFIILKSIFYLFFLDNSILLSIVLFLIITIVLVFCDIKQNFKNFISFEILIEINLSISCYIYKDILDKLDRRMYLNKHKLNENLNHFNGLISGIEGFHFTYINKKLSFVNSNLKNIIFKENIKGQYIENNIKEENKEIFNYNKLALNNSNRNLTEENKINEGNFNLIEKNVKIKDSNEEAKSNSDEIKLENNKELKNIRYNKIDKIKEKIEEENFSFFKNKNVNNNNSNSSLSIISQKSKNSNVEGMNKIQYFTDKISNDFIYQIDQEKVLNKPFNNTLNIFIKDKEDVLKDSNKIPSNAYIEEAYLNPNFRNIESSKNLLIENKVKISLIEEEKVELHLNEFLKTLIFYDKKNKKNSSKSITNNNINNRNNLIDINNIKLSNPHNEQIIPNKKNSNDNFNSNSINKEITLYDKVQNLIDNRENVNSNSNNINLNNINNLNINNNKINISYEKLGEFFSKENSKDEKKFYVVYYRIMDSILDIIMNDISAVKLAEINRVESSVKHKIVAKIAHEFKTPLNSIIGLITQIKENLKSNFFKSNSFIDNNKSKGNVNYNSINIYNINNTNNINNNVFNLKKLSHFKVSNNNINNKANDINNNSYNLKQESLLHSSSSLKTEKNLILKDLVIIEYLSNYTIYLLNDVINFITSEDNYSDIQVVLSKVKIKKILKFCFEVLKALISCNELKQKYINPQLYIDEKIEYYDIYSDEVRLNQILLNLISNAVKFTREGSIIIKANISEDNFLIISIQDTGIGIRPEEKKLIFLDEKIKTNYESNKFGSGLGLSICKIISDKLNHLIKFKSEANFGSIFSLKIKTKENEKFIFNLNSSDFSEENANMNNKESILSYPNRKNKTEVSNGYSNNFDLNSNSNNSIKAFTKKISKSNDYNMECNKFNYLLNDKNYEFSKIDMNQILSNNISENLVRIKHTSFDRPSKFKKTNSSIFEESKNEATRIINNSDMKFIFDYNCTRKYLSDNNLVNKYNCNSNTEYCYTDNYNCNNFNLNKNSSRSYFGSEEENIKVNISNNHNFCNQPFKSKKSNLNKSESNIPLEENLFCLNNGNECFNYNKYNNENKCNNNENEDIINYENDSDNYINIEIFSNNSNSESDKDSGNTIFELNRNFDKEKNIKLNSANEKNLNILKNLKSLKSLNISIDDASFCKNSFLNENDKIIKRNIFKEEEDEYFFNNNIRSNDIKIIEHNSDNPQNANTPFFNSLSANKNKNNIKNYFNTCNESKAHINYEDYFKNSLSEKNHSSNHYSVINSNIHVKKSYDYFTIDSNFFSVFPEGKLTTEKNIFNRKLLSIAIIDDNKYIRGSLKNILESIFKEKLNSNNFDNKEINKPNSIFDKKSDNKHRENIIDYKLLEGNDGVDLLKFVIEDQITNNLKCIFIDESMEYMNGSEAIKIIRSLQKKNKVKKYYIVSVTGFDDNQTKSNLENIGADYVAKKPISKNIVKEILNKINFFTINDFKNE